MEEKKRHTCLKLQINGEEAIFVKGTWFETHFNLSITDGFTAWHCNASEEELKQRAAQWDQPVLEYVLLSERYLGFQQPGSVYAFSDAGDGHKRLSWTFEKGGMTLHWRWKCMQSPDCKKTTAEILDFLMDANIRLSEEVVIKTELFEKTKVEAGKCLAQSETLANARVDFENEIYTKIGAMQLTLASLADQMKNQSVVLSELSKQLGKQPVVVSSPASEGSVGVELQSESCLSWKKVKLPVFDGEDPVAWITRAEIYFDVQNTSEEMKVKLSRLSMEGSTIHWFNLLLKTEDYLSWVKLKKALIARYRGRRLENPFEELSTLRQTGTVEEFVEAFELLSSQVGRLPKEQYLGYFMSGLKAPIRRRVRTLNPSTWMQIMRIAKDVEEELKEEDDESDRRFGKKIAGERMGRSDWFGSRRYRPNPIAKDSKTNSQSRWSNPTQKTGLNVSNASSAALITSTGRISESDARSGVWKGIRSDEIAERLAKDLCFKCGGKYHPTLHKCPEKALRVLILGEGEIVNDDGEIVAMAGELSDVEDEVEVECKSMGSVW